MLEGKIETAKRALKLAADMSKTYYGKPLTVTYSGGKDSEVLLRLAMECLKPDEFRAMNSHTTVDAPQTVYHIRKVFERLDREGIDTEIKKPVYKGEPTTMWKLIVQNGMPPTRIARYCCKVLKEAGTPKQMCALGVRGAESKGRSDRGVFGTRARRKQDTAWFGLDHSEQVFKDALKTADDLGHDARGGDAFDCKLIESAKKNKELVINPIIDWADTDVWEFIRDRKCEYNPLYDMGYSRVGCVGCPLASRKTRMRDFKNFPKYKDNYIRAFDRMLEARKALGKDDTLLKPGWFEAGVWYTGKDVFSWWMEDYKYECDGQMEFDK